MNLNRIDYYPHAAAVRPARLAGAAVAVIDVLRATTTITAALDAGCRQVIPCRTVTQARREAAVRHRRGEAVLLAGERGSVMVPGFDAGNSPLDMRDAKGRTVVLTTSNGTRALHAASQGHLVLAVCLNNLNAAVRRLCGAGLPRLAVLSAGEGRGPADEDDLTAGLLVRGVVRSAAAAGQQPPALSRQARRVLETVRAVRADRLTDLLRATPHGAALERLGFLRDLRFAARWNQTQVVGCLRHGQIEPCGRRFRDC